jgi:hypothetical protein
MCYWSLPYPCSLPREQPPNSQRALLMCMGETGMVYWMTQVETDAGPLGIHFTVEADDRTGPAQSAPFEHRRVSPSPQKPENIDQVIAEVQRWFPDVTVTPDEADPKVFRIVEKSLADKSKGNNPLDQRMTLQMSGTLDGLLGRLPTGSFDKAIRDNGNYFAPNRCFHCRLPLT